MVSRRSVYMWLDDDDVLLLEPVVRGRVLDGIRRVRLIRIGRLVVRRVRGRIRGPTRRRPTWTK